MSIKACLSSKTDLWETPQDLFDKLNAVYHFETDVCAVASNAKCARYFSPEDDGLKQEWGAFVGAIPHTEGRSENGWRKPQNQTRLWLC